MHPSNYPRSNLRNIPDGVAFTVFAFVSAVFGLLLYCSALRIPLVAKDAFLVGAIGSVVIWFMIARALWLAKDAERPGQPRPHVNVRWMCIVSITSVGSIVAAEVEVETWWGFGLGILIVFGSLAIEAGSVFIARIFLIDKVGERMKIMCGHENSGRP